MVKLMGMENGIEEEKLGRKSREGGRSNGPEKRCEVWSEAEEPRDLQVTSPEPNPSKASEPTPAFPPYFLFILRPSFPPALSDPHPHTPILSHSATRLTRSVKI